MTQFTHIFSQVLGIDNRSFSEFAYAIRLGGILEGNASRDVIFLNVRIYFVLTRTNTMSQINNKTEIRPIDYTVEAESL